MEFTLRVPNNSREQNNNTECQHPSKPIIVQSRIIVQRGKMANSQ